MKRLIGVGVGPGDPELVTVKAVRVLREADVVLVPVLAGPDQLARTKLARTKLARTKLARTRPSRSPSQAGRRRSSVPTSTRTGSSGSRSR